MLARENTPARTAVLMVRTARAISLRSMSILDVAAVAIFVVAFGHLVIAPQRHAVRRPQSAL
jgi:hypothetical protein